ncbi:MAG: hemerythrin domain-containing protein [Gammaproteobacteria bacterium]|nr:hemerythrin domain-containing protein [Gammaproteobacteria bacterium]
MNRVADFLAEDHRQIDQYLAETIQAATRADWDECDTQLTAFARRQEAHLDVEECFLLPALEHYTGPLPLFQTIRDQHNAIRSLIQSLKDYAYNENLIDMLKIRKVLVAELETHHRVEETGLYPLADQKLGDAVEGVILRMADRLNEALE